MQSEPIGCIPLIAVLLNLREGFGTCADGLGG